MRRYEQRAQENKKELQLQLDQQVKEFLENGGHIQKIPTGLCVGFSGVKRSMIMVRERENYQNTED
jgi:hypothetical protein